MVLSLLMPLALAAECDNIDGVLDSAFAASVRGRYPESRNALIEAESQFQCTEASPEQVHRFWLIEAISLLGEDRPQDAARAFAAAKTIRPNSFPEQLGSKMKEEWQKAKAPTGSGLVALSPHLADGQEGRVDGQPTEWPASVSAGPHLVQVLQDNQVRFGELLMVNAQHAHTLNTGLLAPSSKPALPTKQDPPPKKKGLSGWSCLLYTSPSPRDQRGSRMPSSA